MSKLNKLIQELCPNGVEYRKLGEIGEYIRGVTYDKKSEVQNECDAWKVFRANNITLSSNTLNFNDIKLVSKSVKVKESQKLVKDDILICAGSGSKDHIGKVAYIFSDIDYTFGGFMGVIRVNKNILMSRFLFHILTGSLFSKHLEINLNSSTINNLNSQIMNSFEIPLPPLPIQEEIVKILDRFAEYTAELQAELQARKEQYEYYRNLLLTNNFAYGSADDKQKITGNAREEWKWMKMSEIAEIKRGVRVVKNDLSEDCCLYPVFQNCLTPLGYKEASNRKGGIPFIIVGGAAGSIGYSNSDFWAADDCLTIEGNSRVSNRYIYHYLNTKQQYLLSQVRKSSVPRLSRVTIENLMVPVPLLDEQLRIVAILDKFDTLVSDLTQGLPAEIAASQERYEYYRDKLLRFERCN